MSEIEGWAQRAMLRWPNVPHLYGWLGLDRRGRWLIRGEVISRPQIIETISRNYTADERGAWYFQNGPQRGYFKLDAAPLILSAPAEGEELTTHLGTPAGIISRAALDETGNLWLMTARGPGMLIDRDLDWALQRLHAGAGPADESSLATALASPSGGMTALKLLADSTEFVIERIDSIVMPAAFGFVSDPASGL